MNSAEDWIRKLGLQQHPEGGFFAEIYRSVGSIPRESLPDCFSGRRSYATSIYFLLTYHDISVFHRLYQDELWHFYAGDPLYLHRIARDGTYTCTILGRDPEKNQVLQAVVPGGEYFGANCVPGGSYSLLGCTVSPGFEFDDFYMPERQTLLELFPQHKEIIFKLTRE